MIKKSPHAWSKKPKKRRSVQSAAERLRHRLRAVELVMVGHSASEVARQLGDSPRAVAYWVTRFKASGAEGLKEAPRSGRPPRLDPAQTKALRHFIVETRTRSEKITGPVVARYLKEELGVTLTVRQCWRIIKRVF